MPYREAGVKQIMMAFPCAVTPSRTSRADPITPSRACVKRNHDDVSCLAVPGLAVLGQTQPDLANDETKSRRTFPRLALPDPTPPNLARPGHTVIL